MEKKFIINAFDLAQEYFKDKKDLSGQPYMYHMERIAAAIEKERDKKCADKESSLCLYYDKAIAVAFLHDIIEDTDCTEEILYEKGFDKEIVTAVIAITRRKDEQYYFDFIDRANKNDIARLVKIYDLEDNMDIRRLNKFGDYEQKRLKKYWYSWKYLRGEISSIVCNNIIHPDRLFR